MPGPFSLPIGVPLKPVNSSRQRLTIDDTVGGVALTVPASAVVGVGRLETAQVRVTLDTAAPTSTTGMLFEVGERIIFENRTELTNFRAIRTTATSGVLEIEYSTLAIGP